MSPTYFCDPRGVTLKGKADTHGPTVKYSVMLANANTDKTSSFSPAGLVVTLPPGVTYVKATATAGDKTSSNKTLPKPVYDAQAKTLTWPDAPLAARRKRKYTVVAKVLPTAASPLVFQAACPHCPQLATQSSVTVRTACL